MTTYDAEIDLQPYILSLIRNWWKIGLLVLVAAILAIVISLGQPRVYKTTATLLITRSQPSLALAQQFPTLVEPVDSASRLNALLSISYSDSVAMNSINALKDDLQPEDQVVEEIKKKVSVTSSGDVILVTGSALDPQLAAKIANVWAEQAVLSINTAYSGEQLPSRIQNQLEETKLEYETAQTALESFLRTSQETFLEGQLYEAEYLFNNMTNMSSWQINYYTQRLQNMDQLIVQAEALKQQLENGHLSTAAGIGDAVAVLQFRAGAFGLSISPMNVLPITSEDPTRDFMVESVGNDNFSVDLQIGDLSSFTNSDVNYDQDLDALITLARSEKSKAEEILQNLSLGSVPNQTDYLLQEAANQVQVLTALLENEQAQINDLTSHRDLTWKAYQAMAEKETELRNATQTSSVVSMATEAVPPQEPSPGGLIVNTTIAIAISLLIGSLVVIGSHWWRSTSLASELDTSSPVVDLN